MHVKRREKSAEVKLSAVTPQEVPKGFIPYFKIIGRAQTINDNNYFGGVFFNTCGLAVYKVVNSVLLKHSTDGVILETGCTVHTMMKYLGGISIRLSFTDTKHNVKN